MLDLDNPLYSRISKLQIMKYHKRYIHKTSKSSTDNYILTLKERMRSSKVGKQNMMNSSFKSIKQKERETLFIGIIMKEV